MASRKAGFTLVELVVVVLVLGILGAIAVPQYMKAKESSLALSAANLATTLGIANRAFAADHDGVYASGLITSTNPACLRGAACPPTGASSYHACSLMSCGLVPYQDFQSQPYLRYVDTPAGGVCTASPLNMPPGTIACVHRKNDEICVSCGGQLNNHLPYKNWAYGANVAGIVTAYPASDPAPDPN